MNPYEVTQKIGCFEVDIKEAMQKKLDEFGIELSDFLQSEQKKLDEFGIELSDFLQSDAKLL